MSKTVFGLQRRVVAAETSRAWKEAPHVSFTYEMNFTQLYDCLLEAKTKGITINTVILKLITEALKKAPKMNATLQYSSFLAAGKLETHDEIAITLPMTFPNGKMMSVRMHHFENKTLCQMQREADRVSEKVRHTDLNAVLQPLAVKHTAKLILKGHLKTGIGRLLGCIQQIMSKERYGIVPEGEGLQEEDLLPGTITVSNLGSLYPKMKGYPSLIEIIPPMVCAIALGAIQEKAMVGESVYAGRVLPICIVFDHRALDFGDIIPFIRELDQISEKPELLRSWIEEE